MAQHIIIVMDDANLDLAVDGGNLGRFFGTTGASAATAASRVAVHKVGVPTNLLAFALWSTHAKKLRVGNRPRRRFDKVPHQRGTTSRRDGLLWQIGQNEGAKRCFQAQT